MEPGTKPEQCDVAIVGGGPVGLGLAIDLAQRGVSCIVVERSTSLHRIPKGQNLTQRSGEHFRSWGVSRQIRQASPIPHDFGNAGVVAYGTLLGDYSYDWFKRGAVNRFYFAENERLPQYETERVLRERAGRLDRITVYYGWKADRIVQDDTGVAVEIAETGSGIRKTVHARYGVGCDGSRSYVRKAAGIEQDVGPHGKRMALLVFRSRQLHTLLERFPGKSIYNILNPKLEGYWQFLGRVDPRETWFYHAPVSHDTTADNFDFHAYLHEAIGAEFAIEFDHIGFWDLRIAVAKTYRNGRWFIAGDAAHSHPPYGGYGVNTGFEDARNLSWKLAGQIAGWAGKGLLDTYTPERKPVFDSTSRDFIGRMIADDRAFGRNHAPGRDRAAFEAAWADRASGGNADVTQYLPNYAGSKIVWGEAGASSGARGKHMLKARAGHHLAPQPLSSGQDMFDALGTGYALISLGGDPSVREAFGKAAAGRGIPIVFVDDTPEDGREDYEARYILVRPDLFVAWAGDDPDGAEGAILQRASGG